MCVSTFFHISFSLRFVYIVAGAMLFFVLYMIIAAVLVAAAAVALNGLCASALQAHCYKDPRKIGTNGNSQMCVCIRNWDGAY